MREKIRGWHDINVKKRRKRKRIDRENKEGRRV